MCIFHSHELLAPKVLDPDGVASVVEKPYYHYQSDSLVWAGPERARPLAVACPNRLSTADSPEHQCGSAVGSLVSVHFHVPQARKRHININVLSGWSQFSPDLSQGQTQFAGTNR